MCAALLALAAGGCTQNYLAGIAAQDRGDLVEAERLLTLAANREPTFSFQAEYALAMLYRTNTGGPFVLPEDERLPEVARWFRAAAENGHPLAQYELALMVETGAGLAQDYPEATAWYHHSAEQGTLPAQLRLATVYSEGIGVERDPACAILWWRLASAGGHAESQRRLDAAVAPLEPFAARTAAATAVQFAPGLEYDVVTKLPRAVTVTLIGKVRDLDWYAVADGGALQGFVPASDLEF